jgi:hypothetical protein
MKKKILATVSLLLLYVMTVVKLSAQGGVPTLLWENDYENPGPNNGYPRT